MSAIKRKANENKGYQEHTSQNKTSVILAHGKKQKKKEEGQFIVAQSKTEEKR